MARAQSSGELSASHGTDSWSVDSLNCSGGLEPTGQDSDTQTSSIMVLNVMLSDAKTRLKVRSGSMGNVQLKSFVMDEPLQHPETKCRNTNRLGHFPHQHSGPSPGHLASFPEWNFHLPYLARWQPLINLRPMVYRGPRRRAIAERSYGQSETVSVRAHYPHPPP
jgi:hypothetical protein